MRSSHGFEPDNVQAAKYEAHKRADQGHEGCALNKWRSDSTELKDVVNGREEQYGDDVEGVPFFEGGVDKVTPRTFDFFPVARFERADRWTADVVRSYLVFCETDAKKYLVDACLIEEGEEEKQGDVDEAWYGDYSA